MAVDWYGDKIRAKMKRAMAIGVNRTMAESVLYAKENHAFTNRTTTAEKSIRIQTMAKDMHGMITGIWGSMTTKYFKYLEFGTELTRGRTSIRQRVAGAKTSINKPAKNAAALPWNGGSYAPTLRPAAARTYPNLAAHIKAAYSRG